MTMQNDADDMFDTSVGLKQQLSCPVANSCKNKQWNTDTEKNHSNYV